MVVVGALVADIQEQVHLRRRDQADLPRLERLSTVCAMRACSTMSTAFDSIWLLIAFFSCF